MMLFTTLAVTIILKLLFFMLAPNMKNFYGKYSIY